MQNCRMDYITGWHLFAGGMQFVGAPLAGDSVQGVPGRTLSQSSLRLVIFRQFANKTRHKLWRVQSNAHSLISTASNHHLYRYLLKTTFANPYSLANDRLLCSASYSWGCAKNDVVPPKDGPFGVRMMSDMFGGNVTPQTLRKGRE